MSPVNCAAKQRAQQSKKAEDKKKELEEFIRRFSANVAKSKQATSRKKMIEKLNIGDIKPSSRRYPAIIFERERVAGDQILNVEGLSKSNEEELLFRNIDFNLSKGDKVAVISRNSKAVTAFFEILANNRKADAGKFQWGITTTQSYLPLDNYAFFQDAKSQFGRLVTSICKNRRRTRRSIFKRFLREDDFQWGRGS